jgi:hypothetical protein
MAPICSGPNTNSARRDALSTSFRLAKASATATGVANLCLWETRRPGVIARTRVCYVAACIRKAYAERSQWPTPSFSLARGCRFLLHPRHSITSSARARAIPATTAHTY